MIVTGLPHPRGGGEAAVSKGEATVRLVLQRSRESKMKPAARGAPRPVAVMWDGSVIRTG